MSTAQSTPLSTPLPQDLRGELLTPGDGAYEDARQLFNAMIDRRPGMIIRCFDVADVIAGVRHAARTGMALAVRGGGHNGAGLGSVDGGLCLDLSPMHGVRVDPQARIATAQGGCQWGDVDHATHAFGLATPSGIISTTGVGGLTLGGGIGHLSRRHGLSVDNLVGADVVLADGRLVHTSADEEPDLFWALRGGGGNFGVVTSFEFALHPVDNVVAGPMLWPIDMAEEVLEAYDAFIRQAPEELNGFYALLTVPPAPPFPPELHHHKMCGVVWCWTGPPEEADAALAPMRAFAQPALDGVATMPFPVLQSAFDELYPKGLQWYWRAHFIDDVPAEAVGIHGEFGRRLPTMHSTMHLYPIDGAVHRAGPSDTAFAARDSQYAMVIVGVDPDPASAGALRQWCVDYWDAIAPFAAAGAYVNFLMDEGGDRIRATYRDNYDRLTRVKAQYDPQNLFHVNQNIPPAS